MKARSISETSPATTRPSAAAPSIGGVDLRRVRGRLPGVLDDQPADAALGAGGDLGHDGADHGGGGGQLQRRDEVRHRRREPQLRSACATSRRRRSPSARPTRGVGDSGPAAHRRRPGRRRGRRRSPTTDIQGRQSRPNSDRRPPQPTTSGARATSGTVWLMITKGRRPRSAVRKRCITMARPRPTTTPTSIPTSATRNVNHAPSSTTSQIGVSEPRRSGSPKRGQHVPHVRHGGVVRAGGQLPAEDLAADGGPEPLVALPQQADEQRRRAGTSPPSREAGTCHE